MHDAALLYKWTLLSNTRHVADVHVVHGWGSHQLYRRPRTCMITLMLILT